MKYSEQKGKQIQTQNHCSPDYKELGCNHTFLLVLVYELPRQEKGLQIQKRLRTSAPNKTNLSIASTSLLPSEQVRCTSKELKTYNLLFHDLCTSFSAFHNYLKIIVGLKNMYTRKSLFFWTDLNQSFQAQHLGVSFGGQSLLWGEWPSGPAEKVESTLRTSNPYKCSGFERGSQDFLSRPSRTLLQSFSCHWQ